MVLRRSRAPCTCAAVDCSGSATCSLRLLAIGRGFRHRQFLRRALSVVETRLAHRAVGQRVRHRAAPSCTGFGILADGIRFKKGGPSAGAAGRCAASVAWPWAQTKAVPTRFGLCHRGATQKQVLESASQGQAFFKFGSTEPKALDVRGQRRFTEFREHWRLYAAVGIDLEVANNPRHSTAWEAAQRAATW